MRNSLNAAWQFKCSRRAAFGKVIKVPDFAEIQSCTLFKIDDSDLGGRNITSLRLVGRSFLLLMQTIAGPLMLWPALSAANSMLWPSLRHRMLGLLEALPRVEMKFDFL
jgi:hypothetical protein